jgi:hypothetical protein
MKRNSYEKFIKRRKETVEVNNNIATTNFNQYTVLQFRKPRKRMKEIY